MGRHIEMEVARKKNHHKSSESDFSDASVDCYDSVLSKHKCTDIICTLIFLVFISLLVAVSVFAYANGNPSDLILPHDSNGALCGKTEGLENKPYLFFFDITRCISYTTAVNGCSTKQICVEKCPDENAYKKISSQKDLINKFCDPEDSNSCPEYLLKSGPVFGRCVPALIADLFNNSISAKLVEAFDKETNETVPIQITTGNGTSDLTYNTLKKSISYLKDILNLKETFELAYEDLSQCVWIILLGLFLGAIITFIWMFVLRYIIKPMIYVTILVVLVLLGFGAYFCFNEFIVLKNNKATSDLKFEFEKAYDLKYLSSLKETWLVIALLQGVLFIILFLIIVFIRKRINMAAELIREVSKAIVLIPASLVWPFVPFLLEIGIIVYCSSIALYLASSGVQLFKVVDTNLTNITANTTYDNYNGFFSYSEKSGELLRNRTVQFKIGAYCQPDSFYEAKRKRLENDPSIEFLECYFFNYGFDTELQIDIGSATVDKYYTRGMEFINNYQWLPQVFVIFMLFWLTAFMIALNEMTLAGSFGAYYWTRFENLDSQLSNKLPFFTLLDSLGRALFYHLGTIAFGSLLIAIVKMIRVLLEFLSRKLKHKVDVSKVAKYIVCCLKCCFWCLERFIKFLNRYAFIITAVYSLNFCSAARKAFKLITSNVLRVVIIDKITGFILFLSNVAITAIVGILGFAFFSNKIQLPAAIMKFSPDLNYYFVPLFIIILGVFIITKLFFDVFTMGVDTLLICVLIDVDMNDGSKARPYFMSRNLRKLLKISNKQYEEEG